MSAVAAPLSRVPASTLAAYGLFGMPLAMAALPLYVHLPKFYGDHLGVDLAVLGSVLLVLRLADGVVDPLLGVVSDRGGARKRWLLLAAPLLSLGMIALFTPMPRAEGPLIVWLSLSLALVYGAFSLATINHQAWGAELSGDAAERTRITAVREGLALFGVVIAAVLPAFLGGEDGFRFFVEGGGGNAFGEELGDFFGGRGIDRAIEGQDAAERGDWVAS